MLSQEEIRQALRAGRVIPLGVANPHGPLGLEQLAAATARLAPEDSTALAIRLRRETRERRTRSRVEGDSRSDVAPPEGGVPDRRAHGPGSFRN
jgi:hypothetical protein